MQTSWPTPGGASGALQYDNGGVFAGIPGWNVTGAALSGSAIVANDGSSLTINSSFTTGHPTFAFLVNGISRGAGLGNYLTGIAAGSAGLLTNASITINGAVGTPPPGTISGEAAYMLGVNSDVDPHPAIVAASQGGSVIRGFFGNGRFFDFYPTAGTSVLEGTIPNPGLYIYAPQTFVDLQHNWQVFIRMQEAPGVEAQIGTASPGKTSINLNISTPNDARLILTTGTLKITSGNVIVDPDGYTPMRLLANDMTQGPVLSIRNAAASAYGWDWRYDTIAGKLRLSSINGGTPSDIWITKFATGDIYIPNKLSVGQTADPTVTLDVVGEIKTAGDIRVGASNFFRIGGNTATDVAFLKNGAVVQAWKGDVSGYASFEAAQFMAHSQFTVLRQDNGNQAGAIYSQSGSIQFYNNGFAADVLTLLTSGNAQVARDLVCRNTIQSPQSSVTPGSNGQLVVEATSNTTLTWKLKGSDGTVRSSTVTLT